MSNHAALAVKEQEEAAGAHHPEWSADLRCGYSEWFDGLELPETTYHSLTQLVRGGFDRVRFVLGHMECGFASLLIEAELKGFLRTSPVLHAAYGMGIRLPDGSLLSITSESGFFTVLEHSLD